MTVSDVVHRVTRQKQMFPARQEPIEMLEELSEIKLTKSWANQNCN